MSWFSGRGGRSRRQGLGLQDRVHISSQHRVQTVLTCVILKAFSHSWEENAKGQRRQPVPTVFEFRSVFEIHSISFWGVQKCSPFKSYAKATSLADSQGGTNMKCHVPSYVQDLVWLQAFEHFQQVVGPPKCPPITSGAGVAGRKTEPVQAGMWKCLESGFSSASLWDLHLLVFLLITDQYQAQQQLWFLQTSSHSSTRSFRGTRDL